MGKYRQQRGISDEFWAKVEPLIPAPPRKPACEYRRKPGGDRKPLPARQVFVAIVFVLRTGIQWRALPKYLFGSPSSIHRYFQQWRQGGFFCGCGKLAWPNTTICKALPGSGKALMRRCARRRWRLRRWGRTPLIGEKNGSKRSLLVDARGIPLSLVASGANTHDVKLLEETLAARVVQPDVATVKEQHLCADAAYVGQSAQQAIAQRGLIAHVRSRKQEEVERDHGPQARPRLLICSTTGYCHSLPNTAWASFAF